MKILLDASLDQPLIDQTREQILSALHAGLVHRGDRMPSLRQVASAAGLNVKTVMRIYNTLQREGLVVLRRGSGAFVGATEAVDVEPEQALGVARLLRRHLDEASGMDLPPEVYASLVRRYVTRSVLRKRSVAVMECNEEQVRLFAREIRMRLGVTANPVLISGVESLSVSRVLQSSTIIAVTDFHRAEGKAIAHRFGKPLVRIRLRRDYVPSLMEAARRGHLAMIVHDASFFAAFKRTLGVLGLKREHLERIRVAEGSHPSAVQRAVAHSETVYLSPLCDRAVRRLVPPSARILSFTHHLAAESIEMLEASLLLTGVEPANGRSRR
jgi:GntR family transcriptional regulator